VSPLRGARLALVGFTGTGKTTIATGLLDELDRRGQPAQLVKLAAPLYRLQHIYYSEAGISLPPGIQDQELMAEIATRLRRISPDALLKQFLTTLAKLPPDTAIVNDDLRVPDPDAAGLRSAGFCLIRLECPDEVRRARLAGRSDHSIIDEPAVFGPMMTQIPTELTINTHTATPAEAVHRVLDHLRKRHPASLEVTDSA
jgi:hypothetical protein